MIMIDAKDLLISGIITFCLMVAVAWMMGAFQ